MTYQEVQQKSLQVEWETVPCHQGEDCWCRMIKPATPIIYNEDDAISDEHYICGSGSLDKKTAEHIVKVHNESLKK